MIRRGSFFAQHAAKLFVHETSRGTSPRSPFNQDNGPHRQQLRAGIGVARAFDLQRIARCLIGQRADDTDQQRQRYRHPSARRQKRDPDAAA